MRAQYSCGVYTSYTGYTEKMQYLKRKRHFASLRNLANREARIRVLAGFVSLDRKVSWQNEKRL